MNTVLISSSLLVALVGAIGNWEFLGKFVLVEYENKNCRSARIDLYIN
ncbi:MAG: hypothetical protein WBG73_04275 [Coleofasciculaceae cyanobacterium]